MVELRLAGWFVGLAASFAFGIAGCSGSSDPVPLPPLTSAPLTTEATIQLVHAMGDEKDTSPSDVMGLQTLLSGGWGDTQAGAGEGVAPHTLDGSAPPSPSASPKLLARFVHLADTQLSDDESPSRTVEFDTMGSTYAAYRPQEAWICKMLNAAVRTIEKVHETLPFEFVLLGGDNADNAQTNEEDWFLGILGGAPRVECDSGNDDDPTPGPNNDPKDPFIPTGLTMPWKWVTGNHDVLNQGNFRPFDKLDDYLGNASSLGTRDWAQVGAPMTTGSVIPDARRQPLDRTALMLKIAGDGDGHGITAEAKAAGKAYYHFDVAGGAVRIVVLDTAAETGGADGVLHRADMMSFVKPALDEAETLGKYVILVSHHSAPTLTTGGGLGIPQADAVLQDEWETFLGGYPHVMMHLGAHTHLFRVQSIHPMSGHAFYEAETASLADWPGEIRMFEIWEHDTQIQIRAIPIDYSVENDPVTAEGRRRAAADFTSGWVDPTVGPGPDDSRAVELWFPKVLKK